MHASRRIGQLALLPEELAWLATYHAATRLVCEIVDMPDRRLSLLVRFRDTLFKSVKAPRIAATRF